MTQTYITALSPHGTVTRPCLSFRVPPFKTCDLWLIVFSVTFNHGKLVFPQLGMTLGDSNSFLRDLSPPVDYPRCYRDRRLKINITIRRHHGCSTNIRLQLAKFLHPFIQVKLRFSCTKSGRIRHFNEEPLKWRTMGFVSIAVIYPHVQST